MSDRTATIRQYVSDLNRGWEPPHWTDESQPCVDCGARWEVRLDGGTLIHNPNCALVEAMDREEEDN